jgi:plastocyanin
MKWLTSIILIILLIGLVSLGFLARLQNAPTPTSVATISSTNVEIKNMAFSPADLQVKIGDTVTFTNNDSVAHTVTSDTGTFDSGTIEPGKSYTKTFDTAGTFAYHCTIHPSMKAKIEVK